MQMASFREPSEPAGRIAFIGACWHRDIVDQCRNAFARTLADNSVSEIDFYDVPGVFEIPLHAKLIARQGRHAAIVAAGAR